VIEDLDDVGAAKLSRGLGLPLETRVRLGHVGHLALDEFHGARRREAQIGRLPDRSHAAATDHPRELEPFRDDRIF
jgi:hypothetical protein